MVADWCPAGCSGRAGFCLLSDAVLAGLGIPAVNGYPRGHEQRQSPEKPGARDTVPMHNAPQVNTPPKASRHGSRGNRGHRGRGWLVLLAALAAGPAHGEAELPQHDGNQHLGVASCAASSCHGSTRPREATDVLQNEFFTWHRRDPHAGAWDALRTERARAMARRLGVAPAHEAPACLDCHADNVPPDRRGDRFRISDGVGCEACHGGAGEWIRSHSDSAAGGNGEAPAGMYPTADPAARTRLCMSCHYSHPDTPMRHRLMSAGHPPLLFDTDVFTHIQPRHFRADADYRRRNGDRSGLAAWATGEIVAADVVLGSLADGVGAGAGMFPELYYFECDACHHALADDWTPGTTAGLAPGSLRLADASLRVVAHVLAEIRPALAQRWSDGVAALHAATRADGAAVRDAAARLRAIADTAEQRLADTGMDAAEAPGVMRRIVREGVRTGYRDRGWAEQAVMALASLLAVTEDEGVVGDERRAALRAALDRMYAVFEEGGYAPARFREGLRRFAGALD